MIRMVTDKSKSRKSLPFFSTSHHTLSSNNNSTHKELCNPQGCNTINNQQKRIHSGGNPYNIIIKDSPTHGKGAYATKPLKKGWLSRYAPDVDYLLKEDADKLPHYKQDYLLLVNRKDGPPAYLNGEGSSDFSVFINHSWRKDNIELDDEGEVFLKKDINKATEERPVELLLNYGYLYWWDKILRQNLIGGMTTGRKRWLEVVIPDDYQTLSIKDKKTYSDWHEHRKSPHYVQTVPMQKIQNPPTSPPSINTDHFYTMPETSIGVAEASQNRMVENRQCFPTYRRVTLNITSFGPLHDPTKGRLSRVLKVVYMLLRSHDIVYLQETRLTSQDQINLIRTYFDGCHLIGSVSNSTPAQAGVLIIIKNSVMQHYDIQSTYCSTTPLGMGRVVSVAFTPKEERVHNLFSFRETCLYLKSGTGKGDSTHSPQDERQMVVQELCGLPRDTHLSFLGGDMNQHDNKILNPFLEISDMEEVEQDINTFYRMEKEKVKSTRIDRWYCNISAAQSTLINPTCRVLPNVTGTVGRYCSGKLKTIDYIPTANTKGAKHITDHVPVGLYLPGAGEGGNACKATTIPDWVTKQPLFRDIITREWKKNNNFKEEESFKMLEELTNLIHSAAKEVQLKLGANKPMVRHPTWKIALQTYCTLHKTADKDKVITAAQEDSTVINLIDDFLVSGDIISSSSKLRDYLDQHIQDAVINSPIHMEEKMSRVERLSKAFPKHRVRVTSLKDESRTETDDPTEMAKITKKIWEKHYCIKRLSVQNLSRFWRRHYQGKLISVAPEEVTLESVEKEIIESGDTAPGPDNIPFSVYRAIVGLAAPVLHGVIKQLMKGVLPPSDFNNAIFHLLPKKNTGWVSDTRPLSVSNTANRIIASVIKKSIQDSLSIVLSIGTSVGFGRGGIWRRTWITLTNFFIKLWTGKKSTPCSSLTLRKPLTPSRTSLFIRCLPTWVFQWVSVTPLRASFIISLSLRTLRVVKISFSRCFLVLSKAVRSPRYFSSWLWMCCTISLRNFHKSTSSCTVTTRQREIRTSPTKFIALERPFNSSSPVRGLLLT